MVGVAIECSPSEKHELGQRIVKNRIKQSKKRNLKKASEVPSGIVWAFRIYNYFVLVVDGSWDGTVWKMGDFLWD